MSAEAAEEKIRTPFDRGELDEAATALLEAYGAELLGFIIGRVGDEPDGAEVFSQFAEDLWKGLAGFRWQTSARSWAYTLARNAATRYQRAPERRRERNLELPESSRFAHALDRARSTTKMHARSEVKTTLRELREHLPDDDQALLILRIDRQMSWPEIAVILSGQGDKMPHEERSRWAARLRKRFQSVKDRLRERAREEGLI